MATCVDVAKASYPKSFNGKSILPMEGKSIVPAFNGQPLNRGKIFWEHEANIAYRNGNWKLVASTHENAAFDPESLHLYDLSEDPTEMNDLSKVRPDLLKTMYSEWQQWGNRVEIFPMDTRPYGKRIQDYRRSVNGDFDDLLGGWNINRKTDIIAEVGVDQKGQVNGNNALLIKMIKPGIKPDALFAAWPFQAKKGEKFVLELKGKASQNSTVMVRLERAGGQFNKVIDQKFSIGSTTRSASYVALEIPSDGNYRIGLYFGILPVNSKVWIDDVNLRVL